VRNRPLYPHSLFPTLGVIFVKRASLTFIKMVKRGTAVSLLCSNILKYPSYIAWFKLTNDSLPLCIVTQYVGEKPADSIYFNGFKKNHVEMSVNKTLSSLKILNVEISDSGIFYCGKTNQSTGDTANTDCGATEETLRSCHIYYTLTLILSGLVLIPTFLATVVLIRLKERNKQKEGIKYTLCLQFLYCQEEDADLNYAALSLDKKKSRRPVRRLK
uniref:Ig-like domain-containing protein n=1 Tax=Sinocyclocheilus rhinocerous TaxID=307959 RepID=A0A673HBW2_9TELE